VVSHFDINGVLKMEAIIFIGTYKAGSSRDALKAAKALGYYTILITPNKRYLVQRKEFTEVDKLIFMEEMSFNSLYKKCKSIQESGVDIKLCISFIDPYVYRAAKLSEALNLSQVSTESLFILEDKTRFREVLKGHPSNPFFTVYTRGNTIEECYQECHKHFPLMLKPPVSNGSKDVFFVDSEEEFYIKMRYLLSKYSTSILIEEFVSGTQYIVEALIFKGKVIIAGIIEQELNKNFVVTGYSYPAVMDPEAKEKLLDSVNTLINQIELFTGTCHLEMRLSNGEWKLIEVNPRMSGGAMNQIIYEGSGINLAKETIKLYLGEEPKDEFKSNKYVFCQFLTVARKGELLKVTGRNRASKHKGVKKVFVFPRKGAILSPPLSMGNRYAYVIASASKAETAETIAKKASREIKFHLKPL
jgi:biotin carboxylase